MASIYLTPANQDLNPNPAGLDRAAEMIRASPRELGASSCSDLGVGGLGVMRVEGNEASTVDERGGHDDADVSVEHAAMRSGTGPARALTPSPRTCSAAPRRRVAGRAS